MVIKLKQFRPLQGITAKGDRDGNNNKEEEENYICDKRKPPRSSKSKEEKLHWWWENLRRRIIATELGLLSYSVAFFILMAAQHGRCLLMHGNVHPPPQSNNVSSTLSSSYLLFFFCRIGFFFHFDFTWTREGWKVITATTRPHAGHSKNAVWAMVCLLCLVPYNFSFSFLSSSLLLLPSSSSRVPFKSRSLCSLSATEVSLSLPF